MGVMDTLRAPKLLAERLRPPEQQSEHCLNCGAQLIGPFCAQCGQRDIPPYPSVRELVTDAFWELSGWDGRFAGTVRALIRTPGQLTIEFLEGRRARFISPLRLYLLASLVYFVVAAAAPDNSVTGLSMSAPGIEIGAGTAANRVSVAEQKVQARDLTPAERDSALADIAHAPRVLRPILTRALTDRAGFKRSLLETMPRVLFALVPVFAGILALVYRRRKYPEHLYFALHLHAFIFVALTVLALARFANSALLSGVVGPAVAVWMLYYSNAAKRRVYGGGVVATVGKGAVIVTLYAIAGILGLLVAVFWAGLHG